MVANVSQSQVYENDAYYVNNNVASITLENEIVRMTNKLASKDITEEQYSAMTENIRILAEADERILKGHGEEQKAYAQTIEAEHKYDVDPNQLLPKGMSIGAFVLVTCFMFALERQTPISMRFLKAMDALLTPHGI